ncbi:octanoyl-[GcvH]:protein N-octanoyltransferase [Anoxybacillus pushchinoensis]|uniref:Octanoyl-[GcvH]:protein N-octanoyltransferase n=1 Tax=Anoxybacillus pushchinoensis TaxID=150248 RepID=A0A1I0SJK3_9BACL|nr:biotin/lipoate A/B protein ligase family protein [Anoxybacillus pushchinoensis]SFA39670.1 octanoyl-[GcvH]:protein N-octanoyltransferase [Anoxybacillus pushchinoensis]
MSELLRQQTWRIIDHSSLGPLFDAKQSFAFDDALCESVGNGHSQPIVRLWVHHHTVVLGIQDTKLPHIERGLAYLHEQGWHTIVRNSGGLAVVLDEGVLNVSLIFPDTKKGIDIDRGYEAMAALIARMLSEVHVQAGEVVGSYCPGSFDLSIDGKKFAGISQRRIRGGVAVQAYICVSGSGAARAEWIRQFYERSLAGKQTKFTYPTIVPHTMASLSELLGKEMTVSTLIIRLYEALQSFGSRLEPSSLTSEEWERYYMYFQRMIDRNEMMLPK